MKSLSRTTVLAAGAAAVAAVLSGPGAAVAQAAPAEPLVTTGDVGVRTGDLDLLEDVLEHISIPFGHKGTLTHQLYDSRGTDAG
ncbi:hypothetical protein ACFU9Y_37320 [Streptomyces sp. NPDC057621]|uniref:Uncharacterized protein n=1 Tax=Streptomyces liliiviolaceus TaxID=2823109 RepID=A0A940Y3A0_9ACTN|nr:hypothetical protein [Streptomyces liliiviolaceus]MBQ0852412.1 hypothetical protein [Streptomyces liliiviolaceus]